MKKKWRLLLTAALLLGAFPLSAQYRGNSVSAKPYPFRKQVQRRQSTSEKKVSDCPACRANAKKNYDRKLQQNSNRR